MVSRTSGRLGPVDYYYQVTMSRRRYLTLKIRHCCRTAGVEAMLLPFYFSFGLELEKQAGIFKGLEHVTRVSRQLVAEWTRFGLDPEMLRELVYLLTNLRLMEERAEA